MADRNRDASNRDEQERASDATSSDELLDSGNDGTDLDSVDADDLASESDKDAPIVRKHSTSPVRKAASKDKKAKASDKREQREKRANPVSFTRQSVAELKKVVWPTGDQVGQYFVVVLVFVVVIMAIVAGLDLGLTRLLLWLIG